MWFYFINKCLHETHKHVNIRKELLIISHQRAGGGGVGMKGRGEGHMVFRVNRAGISRR